ncbi:unnamed protein product [Orchesella dallaii]|uniref:Uncharacterized protein n=1 Tax=Orchesella dallaii TaxID=48710 RepID=A0ABP1R9V1_9HEXA
MQLSELSTFSNPYTGSTAPNHRRKKFIKEEIELRDRAESDISPYWKILTLLSYLMTAIGGITTSISIGSLLAAFHNNCVLYGRLTMRGLDEVAASGNRTLYEENIANESYGLLADCTYCEYCSAASTVVGTALGCMFFQCGRGGVTGKSLTKSWIIVPPALVLNLVFFILSIVTFAKTIGGLSFFCNNLRSETYTGEQSNITTCLEILSFHFPDDVYNTNLYLDYILAQVGASLTFLGWLISLFILILRCFIPVDFVVYGRRLYEVRSSDADQSRPLIEARNKVGWDEDIVTSTSSTEFSENGDKSIATTSFTNKKVSSYKKLT